MALRRKIKSFFAGSAMLAATLFSGLLVVCIAAALYVRSRPLISHVSVKALVTGDQWFPSSGHFGFRSFLAGTVWVTGVALVIAVPVCMLVSVYLSEFAKKNVRIALKALIDLLAGIPSVVYGVWGLLVVVPFVANVLGPFAEKHLSKIPFLASSGTTGFSVIAGGLVLSIMVCPFIISISDEVLRSIPVELREISYSLGATQYETIRLVVIRKALPGLVGAVVLGLSRALGETMAVLMVVGNVPVSPRSIFDPAYPLTALIANNYGEMMSVPLYDSALLCAALMLMAVVFFFNILARLFLLRAARRTA